jgi:hypothetical protein
MTEFLIRHDADPADLAMIAAVRAQSAPFKGMNSGVAARPGYDHMITAHVWHEMPHVFQSSFAMLKAREAALGLTSAFLRAHLAA